jgi:CRISPR/Cas system CSM-associated protein Csm3 (group 7 of RAMP superfamily)
MSQNESDAFAGDGGARELRARWVVEGILELKTAACFGGGSGEIADLTVLRDQDGAPVLPGTSLAGALRSHLADVLGGYRSQEDPDVESLFGVTKSRSRDDEPGWQSPLIIFDAHASEQTRTEIRDGVAIEAETGTAEKHKKFDAELLPPGTTFPLRFELLLEKRHENEEDILSLFATALEGLGDGSIGVGIRRSRGLGRVEVRDWRAHRFDLSSKQGWLEWLATIPESRLDSKAESWPPADLGPREDHRDRFIADLKLSVDSILIGSPSLVATGPDVSHLTSKGESILSGTSLAGALRNRALRIARAVRNGQGDADQWIDRLFGPRFRDSERAAVTPLGSRLRISENVIRGPASDKDIRLQTVRIAIDRFTQGPIEGALVEEEASYDGAVDGVKVEIRNPVEGEPGLLLLVLKDLLTGDLPIGGTASVGRGVVKGEVAILYEESRWAIDPSRKAEPDTVEAANNLVEEFHAAAKTSTPNTEVKHARD